MANGDTLGAPGGGEDSRAAFHAGGNLGDVALGRGIGAELIFVTTDEGNWDAYSGVDMAEGDGFNPYGDQWDWKEADAAGMHIVGPGHRVTPSIGGKHSSEVTGQLRAGNDIHSVWGD